MRKTYIALLACLALVLSCAGCQLADPDEGEASTTPRDRLIGVYATEEYLDLFDHDAWFRDNADKLAEGGETVVSPQDSEAYSDRLWAVQQDNGDWVFPDLEGMGYYAYRYESEAERGTATHMDAGLTGNGMRVNSTDQGESLELEATIYHTPGGEVRYFFNPVYQTPDGAVYLTSGSGIYMDGTTEGESSAYTLSDDLTTTGPDGASTADGCSVTVHVEIMNAPGEIAVLQMDGESRVLDRKTYAPGQVPERLTPDPDCAYILVETRKTGPDGELVSRELANVGAERFSTYQALESGVCVKQDTELSWPEEAGT